MSNLSPLYMQHHTANRLYNAVRHLAVGTAADKHVAVGSIADDVGEARVVVVELLQLERRAGVEANVVVLAGSHHAERPLNKKRKEHGQ